MKFGKKSAMLKFLGYIKNLSSTGLSDLGFDFFKADYGVIVSASIVGIIVFFIGIYATMTISETHGRDLDFVEV